MSNCIKSKHMQKNRLRTKFSKTLFFLIFQNLLERVCYYFIMDIPPVPNQPTSFKFPKRSFGKANSLNMSFHASWFRPGRGFIMSQKLSQRALKSFLRTSGYIKFSRGTSPESPRIILYSKISSNMANYCA